MTLGSTVACLQPAEEHLEFPKITAANEGLAWDGMNTVDLRLNNRGVSITFKVSDSSWSQYL